MLGKPRILSLFLNMFINSIKHELLCKILYMRFCVDQGMLQQLFDAGVHNCESYSPKLHN